MKKNDLLRLHLALLKLQYGERALLESMASLQGLAVADLESQLIDIEKIGHAGVRKSPTDQQSRSSIESVLDAHPEKANLLRAIQTRFENRTLLPEMKDVRRFLDRHGQFAGSIKVRSKAFPKLIRVLADQTLTDLEVLLNSAPSNEYSGLGVISDEILGRK